MSAPVSTSAANRVLSIPTILGDIFGFLIAENIPWLCECWDCRPRTFAEQEANPRVHATHPLVHCALVNKYWFHEAIRVLWKRPFQAQQCYATSLSEHLRRIAPDRRQLYANQIQWATLISIQTPQRPEGKDLEKKEEDAADALYAGVTFPRMKRLSLGLPESRFYIPKIPSDSIETLAIDEFEGPFWQEHINYCIDDMDKWLSLIAVRFSNVKKVVVVGQSIVGIGRKEEFIKSMPNVEEFDLELMEEMEKEM